MGSKSGPLTGLVTLRDDTEVSCLANVRNEPSLSTFSFATALEISVPDVT